MRRLLLAAGAVLALAACSSSGTGGAGGSSTPPGSLQDGVPHSLGTVTAPSGSTATRSGPHRSPSTSTSTPSPAQQALARMGLRERVGQLLMVDCPTTGVTDATVSAIRDDHVGSVILDGTSQAGSDAIRGITAQLQGDAPSRVRLFISTDQEGGIVQRLQGSGFTRIPSGVEQGTEDPSSLRSQAREWGGELRRAGVNVDLAPVLDVVPAGGGPNPPIGDLDRQYGSTPRTVTSHGTAVAQGLADAGVDATVKHFPGLGRVAGNTDTTADVQDTVTTRDDAYLAPFRAAVRDGVPFVMISTAIYTRIDPAHPAAFSRTVITGMLRQDLGFGGVVISDDIGAAAQVRYLSPGQRAVQFVQAGGDVVLTVDATQAGAMTEALYEKARTDPAFRALVNAAALRVLTAKQARGLLG